MPNRLLYLVDANTFASLTLLSRQWRGVSDCSELYAYHLSRCSLYSITNDLIAGQISGKDLRYLKEKFAREIRRNNFEVFRQPHRTVVQLISSSTGSATALPYGEALKFFFSSNGRFLICLSSARIFILDLTGPEIKVAYSLKVRRRPSVASINDDGTLLAVVTSRVQVNVYQLADDEVNLVQHLVLKDIPRTLALSPGRSILAVAFDEGIELFALGENIVPTQRRAVRCKAVDTLSFVGDGFSLFGSSLNSENPGLVTVNAPLPFDGTVDVAAFNAQNQIWSTQVLFPEQIAEHSHASLLANQTVPDNDWVLTFDHELHAYRVVRTGDPKTGAIIFVGPCRSDQIDEPLPDIAPAVDANGELAAVSFHGQGIWVYGFPDRLDVTPFASTITVGATFNQHNQFDANSNDNDDAYVTTNLERLRTTTSQPSILICGSQVAEFPAVTAARWVSPPSSESKIRHRFVAVAPGGVPSSSLGEESITIDGGRLLVLDFEVSPRDKASTKLTIELGETEAKELEEHFANLEQEVELERQRTLRNLRPVGSPRRRIDGERASGAHRQSFPVGRSSSQRSLFYSQRASRSHENSLVEATLGDPTLFLDDPYTNDAPRSHDTLHRAATSAAAVRQRNTPRHRDSELDPFSTHGSHNNQADNWVPPPPPYSKDADRPLPGHLQNLLRPPQTGPLLPTAQQRNPRRPYTSGRESAMTIRSEQAQVSSTRGATTNRGRVLSKRARPHSATTDEQHISRSRSLFINRRDLASSRADSADPQEQPVPPRQSFSHGGGRTTATQPPPQRVSGSLNESQRITMARRKSLSRLATGIFHRSAVDSGDVIPEVPPLPSHERTENVNHTVTIHSRVGQLNRWDTEQSHSQPRNSSQAVPHPDDLLQFRSAETLQPSPQLSQENTLNLSQRRTPFSQHNRMNSSPIVEYYNNAESVHESSDPDAFENLHILQHSQTEPWRARIEAWNIQTINEIRRTGDPDPDRPPSRQLFQHFLDSKCAMM